MDRYWLSGRVAATLLLFGLAGQASHAQATFRGGVDLVYLTVTVTDKNGRFIENLAAEDFTVLDDGKAQPIVSFSRDRVPVSLGLVLDISGSMRPEMMATARAAIRRFTHELLGAEDELFLAVFSNRTWMLQRWTTDRERVDRALADVKTQWGTAIYDAIRATLPVAGTGTHNKKVLLVLSDGDDQSSRTSLKQLQEIIRSSEVIVYALAVVDGGGGSGAGNLRKITDSTGGRTEVVKGFSNLHPATERLADELNRQYTIAYEAPHGQDGARHSIKVQVQQRGAVVRARSGYQAPAARLTEPAD